MTEIVGQAVEEKVLPFFEGDAKADEALAFLVTQALLKRQGGLRDFGEPVAVGFDAFLDRELKEIAHYDEHHQDRRLEPEILQKVIHGAKGIADHRIAGQDRGLLKWSRQLWRQGRRFRALLMLIFCGGYKE